MIDKMLISETILRLEVNKGHLKWSISDLARFSKISRPLIYYHLGKDKTELRKIAWDTMLTTLFSLENEKTLGIKKRIASIVEKVNASPYLFVLFFLEKNSNSEIGKLIQSHEQKLFKVLKKNYPSYTEDDILKIYLLQLGAVAYRPKDFKDIEFYFPT